jgi:hypothetical protein
LADVWPAFVQSMISRAVVLEQGNTGFTRFRAFSPGFACGAGFLASSFKVPQCGSRTRELAENIDSGQSGAVLCCVAHHALLPDYDLMLLAPAIALLAPAEKARLCHFEIFLLRCCGCADCARNVAHYAYPLAVPQWCFAC